VILLLALLALVWTSLVVQFIFPPPSQAAGWTLWGWTLDRWSTVRFASLCAFLGVTLIHLMLQWDWVCSFVISHTSRLAGRKLVVARAERTLYGVGMLICVMTALGLPYAVAAFAVRSP
jgi:hypothetical protein